MNSSRNAFIVVFLLGIMKCNYMYYILLKVYTIGYALGVKLKKAFIRSCYEKGKANQKETINQIHILTPKHISISVCLVRRILLTQSCITDFISRYEMSSCEMVTFSNDNAKFSVKY